MEQKSSGALEFVPAMVYPERSRVLIMDADGIQVQEGPKELPWTENAADVLPNYPFISGRQTVSSKMFCNFVRRRFGYIYREKIGLFDFAD